MLRIRRVGLFINVLSCCIALSFIPKLASACGATDAEAVALLPLQGDTAVPLEAVLQATSLHSTVEFRLARADTLEEIQVSIECAGTADRYHCIGEPDALLPDTEYQWQVLMPIDERGDSETRTFVTATESAPSSAPAPDLLIEVTTDLSDAAIGGCGRGRRIELSVAASSVDQPLVLSIAPEMTWEGQHAVLLVTGDSAEVAVGNPSNCFSLLSTDIVGNTTEHPATCVGEAIASPTVHNSEELGAVDNADPGCSISPSSQRSDGNSMLALLGAILVLGIGRTRRHLPRHCSRRV